MVRVFVSYASADIVLAREVRQWLADDQHEVFLAEDPRVGIVGGERWRSRLYERLRWADAVVCVVSSVSVASTWCTAEVSSALLWGSRLVPIVAEPGVVHPLLSDVQHIKLTGNPVAVPVALIEALRRVDARGGWGWPDDRSPFPGLRPLDVADHRVFFGRGGEVERLTGLLRSPVERAEKTVLLVVGPSGCGKSSLVRAGLLHVMAGEPGWWTLPPILPGADPVAGLIRELTTAGKWLGLAWTVTEVSHRVEDGGLTVLVDELLLAVQARRLLVVMDQFEEVLTQATPAARARFARLLHPALGGPVQVVATLRPEFLDPLLSDIDLAVLPTRLHPLRPLRRDTLREVIESPARLAGIGVNDELVARMVADTDTGDALPLLAFTLAQLAEGLTRGGQLSSRRYDQIGGVQGALTSQADTALAEASAATGRAPEQVIAGLLRLVTVDEHGRPTRWRVPRGELPVPVVRELDAFVRRRLLTIDTDQSGVVVGATHEAFLSAWAPLAQAIEDNASALRARRAVEQAATEWTMQDRPPARLWERGQLAAALADTGVHPRAGDLLTDRVELSPTARTFLNASIRRDRIRRGRAVTVLSVLLALALIAGGIAVAQQRSAEHQRNLAVSQRVAGQALDLRATNPALAAQLGMAAYQLAPTAEAHGSLLSIATVPYATALIGHTDDVTSAAFSPDGHTLATGSDDHTARLWDVSDPHHPKPLGVLTGHTDTVSSVAFSPDGHTLATGSDGTARLLDVSDTHHPSPLSTLSGHTSYVFSVAFKSDGRTLATGSADGTARLWDVSDTHHPSPLSTLSGHTSYVLSVAFSPDGHTLATGSSDGTARLWDVSDTHHPSPLSTLSGHTGYVQSVAFSPDGHTLATGSYDGIARLWDVSDAHHPSPLSTLSGHTNAVISVAFSPDGYTLATGSGDHTARLWDVSDAHHPSPLSTLSGHTGIVFSVMFSPDGHTLATGSADDTARLWDVPGPVVAAGHTSYVHSVVFSPDGQTLATGSYDGTARLWDVSDTHHPSPLSTLSGHASDVLSVAFSRDGQTLATGSADDTARLWDISDARHPKTLSTLSGHTGIVLSVVFSPDGHTLATGSADDTARLWDISDPHHPNPLGVLTGHTSVVFSVVFSRNGHTLATGSVDGTARLWDISDPHHPNPLGVLTGHTNTVLSVAFSPDGQTLATGSVDDTARLWNVSDLHHPNPLSTLSGHTGYVQSVAFSPDGHTLATGSDDHTARLWDVSDLHHPNPLGVLTGHTDTVSSVAFSPDGQTLATGSHDSAARLWETSIARVTARFCGITPTITRSEWDDYLTGLGYHPPCK